MQQSKFFLSLLALSLAAASYTPLAAQQASPRKYLIKPLNLGLNTEIRARSTRNLQVRVTDENDRPVPDAPILFSLTAESVSGSNVGSFAGQTSARALTNTQGIAEVEYTAGEIEGSRAKVKAQVENSDSKWEGIIIILPILGGGGATLTPINGVPTSNDDVTLTVNKSSVEKTTTGKPEKKDPFISSLILGQTPREAVYRRTFTTTTKEKFSLNSKRGKVVIVFFFGVWCDISRREHQFLVPLLERYKTEEVEVIGMSVKDPRSTPPLFVQFMTDRKPEHPVVQDVSDKHFVDFVNSKNVSVPQTLIYGRDGRLRAHFLGFSPQIGSEMEQTIKEEADKNKEKYDD